MWRYVCKSNPIRRITGLKIRVVSLSYDIDITHQVPVAYCLQVLFYPPHFYSAAQLMAKFINWNLTVVAIN